MWSGDRRSLLLAAACGASSTLLSRRAHATVVRGLTLPLLVRQSSFVLVGSARDSSSRFISLPGSRRIVTDVRIRVEEPLLGSPVDTRVVRVLGGRVGSSAEFVEGQAEFEFDSRCVLFLRAEQQGVHWVSGMAQGHYPLRQANEGGERLAPSPRLPEILQFENSAVRHLSGRTLSELRSWLRGAAP